LTRIAETTNFNGQKLLDGSLGELVLQVGSEANQTISAEIGKLDAKGLGGQAAGDVVGAQLAGTDNGVAALKTITGADGTNTLTVNKQSVGNLSGAASLKDALDIMNSNLSGVEVSAFTELTATTAGTGVIRGSEKLTIDIIGPSTEDNRLEIVDTGSLQEVVDKINSQANGLIQASIDEEGRLRLSNETGAQIKVRVTNDATPAVADTNRAAGATAIGFSVDTGSTTDIVQNAQLAFTITDPNVKNVDITVGTGLNQASLGIQTRDKGDITGAQIATTTNALDIKEGDIKINGVTIAVDNAATPSEANNAQALVDSINKFSADTGVVASLAGAAGVKLDSVDGTEIKLELGDTATFAKTGLIETNSATSVGNSVADIDISTVAGAQKAIGILDDALEQVNSVRGNLGAISNRLDYTMNNLSNISENQAAARSRIEDADFARESANLSRAQVLQQAGTAMLAQANAAPQQVLSLLQ
jgi:flagellin